MLLAIDPGAHTGWAHFELKLTACGLVAPKDWNSLVALALNERLHNVLIEEPTIYPHSKASPATVMKLQLKVGELKGRFEAAGCRVELVQPRSWKGQVPKRICHARAFGKLSLEERVIVQGANHDTMDAVALGLWKLGRYK